MQLVRAPVEAARYDSLAERAFVGIDLGRDAASDETTVLKFRRLIERHHLGDQLFAAIEHRFLIITPLLKFAKVRYWGL